MLYSLAGEWQASIENGACVPIHLPGTLDENRIGGRDAGQNQWSPDGVQIKKGGPILTRLTRRYTYEGEARFSRRIRFRLPAGERLFLEAERARCLRLLLDGEEIPDFLPPTISTPHVFELTGRWRGEHEITLLSDNSYPGLPRDAIVYSSAATDETQTNWNGVLGYFRLRTEKAVFLESVRVYPAGGQLTVKADICAAYPWSGELSVCSESLKDAACLPVSVSEGRTEIVLKNLPLREDAARWDEYEGRLYSLCALLEGAEEKTVLFGIREFGANREGRLALNGRAFFLRGEANCAEFPETGHPPMSVEEWTEILETYRSYGVNCMRFHSHCPPEAAFSAADQLGILMQPELSHWNPTDAFESDESFSYYRTELTGILRQLANHPSFVMLTFGNELIASGKGHRRMDALLKTAHSLDTTRLYANGSNTHYGQLGCDEQSDFYTSNRWHEQYLRGTDSNMRGHINEAYPSAAANYNEAMESLRESYAKPVFSFEVGQFEVLPDFKELQEFKGISDPANLRHIREQVKKKGLLPLWEKYVEATGELSRIGYREEVEAAMRTKQLSGISLLGLQDFPGQGTALVGMLNSHLRPKPYAFAEPEAFRSFFTDRLPLVLLEKYTYESGEILKAGLQIANFGKVPLEGEVSYTLLGADVRITGTLKRVCCPAGQLKDAGTLCISLPGLQRPQRLELTVSLEDISNRYPIWIYPPVKPVCPKAVHEARRLDEAAVAALQAGRAVYLSPPSTAKALPQSVKAQFTTDFWSVGTFPGQSGAMGQLIDLSHPLFRDFPTEFHTNWQWWPMACQRAAILPEPYPAIITEMDSYAYLRPMAQLLECRCGNGRVLFSTLGLQDLQAYPEARALLFSIYRYMASGEFQPQQQIPLETLQTLVC